MRFEVSPADGSKATLSVTLTPEEVDGAIQATYQRLARRVRISGFRPGKAPKAMLLRTYGEDAFYHQATDEAIRRWYPKALDQSGIEPLDRGKLDLEDEDGHVTPGESFSFAATVPTKPVIELPDYAIIKLPAPSTAVYDADVDEVIEGLRARHATHEPAPAKAAGAGDIVVMNVYGRAGGKEVLNRQDFEFELADEDEDGDPVLPGLSEKLMGALRGDIQEPVLELPPDYRDQALAGKSLSLRIVVKEILGKVLPDLDEDFVKTVSKRDKTVAELRDRIRHNLEHEKHDEAMNKVANDVVDSLIARSNVEAPDILVSDQQDRMIREQRRYLEQRGLSFDQFLVALKKSEDEYRGDLKAAALRTVKSDLLLDAVAKAERFEADQEIVDERVREMSEAVSRSERDFERLSGSRQLHQTVSTEMLRRMALNKLVEIASGLTPLVHQEEYGSDREDAKAEEVAVEQDNAALVSG